MRDTVRAIRTAFPTMDKVAYFDFGGVALLPDAAADAACAYVRRDAVAGRIGLDDVDAVFDAARALCAGELGASPDEVTFVRSTTAGLGQVANGLDLRPGDRVVVSGGEFPSSQWPWTTLADRGIDVDVCDPVRGDDGILRWPLDRLVDTLDAGVPPRVCAVSWVQYTNGATTDLGALAAACHARGTLLAVDVIQGLGALPLDVTAVGVDFAAADGHKWLCGPRGLGVLYVRAEHIDQLRVLEPGWNSVVHRMEWDNLDWVPDPTARRFEGGSVNEWGVVALGASVELLSQVPQAERRARSLAVLDHVLEGLAPFGYRCISDLDEARRSAIVTVTHPEHDAATIVAAAEHAGAVVAGPRDGGVRISAPFFATIDDADRLIAALVRAVR